MTKPKLTPDELAHAVQDLIQSNGDVLSALTFETASGEHYYNTSIVRSFGELPTSYFIL